MYRILLLLIGASYFPIAIMTFSVLQCSNGYMKLYQWIPCDSINYYIFLTIGIIVFFSFVVSYPLILSLNLFRMRKKFYDNNDHKNYTEEFDKFKSILEGYRQKIFFFEIIYILEKLSIALALTLLPENSLSQFLLVDLTIIFGMFAQYSLRPYQLNSLNYVVFFSQCVTGLSYFYNILSEMYRSIVVYSAYLYALSWICAIVNGFVLFSFLLLFIEPQLKSFVKRRKYSIDVEL